MNNIQSEPTTYFCLKCKGTGRVLCNPHKPPTTEGIEDLLSQLTGKIPSHLKMVVYQDFHRKNKTKWYFKNTEECPQCKGKGTVDCGIKY